jgi:hypothetical protein
VEKVQRQRSWYGWDFCQRDRACRVRLRWRSAVKRVISKAIPDFASRVKFF